MTLVCEILRWTIKCPVWRLSVKMGKLLNEHYAISLVKNTRIIFK